MDRRGHAMRGMDAVYVHVTTEMRERLIGVLEQLWQTAVAQRYELSPGRPSRYSTRSSSPTAELPLKVPLRMS
jgi:hypothetical protein